MEKRNQRVEWIDCGRGICSFCVLLAHSGSSPDEYLFAFTPFFLMMFFFISGFLHKDKSIKESIKSLLNGLIIPYFVLCFINMIIAFDNIEPIRQGNIYFFGEKLESIFLGEKLWFIPCLIMVQIYYLVLSNIIKHRFFNRIKNLKLIIGILFLFSVFLIRNWNYDSSYWYADNALFAFSYFIIGNYLKGLNLNLEKIVNRKARFFSIAFLLFYCIIAILSQKYMDVEFHMMTNYYKQPIYYILISWFGIAAVILFCINYKLPSYLKLLGQNSLLLFAFNTKIRSVLNILFGRIHLREFFQSDYIYSLFFCLIQGYLILLLAKIINRYVPQIVGKRKWIK